MIDSLEMTPRLLLGVRRSNVASLFFIIVYMCIYVCHVVDAQNTFYSTDAQNKTIKRIQNFVSSYPTWQQYNDVSLDTLDNSTMSYCFLRS